MFVPYKDPEQQRRYQRERAAATRASWFADKTCVRCGSADDLQLDHIDPALKVSHNVWSWSRMRRELELAKCQVLCRPHHDEKSAGEKLHGEQQVQAKLTPQLVREIRASSEPTRAAAARFGVSRATVSRVRCGIDWAHVKLHAVVALLDRGRRSFKPDKRHGFDSRRQHGHLGGYPGATRCGVTGARSQPGLITRKTQVRILPPPRSDQSPRQAGNRAARAPGAGSLYCLPRSGTGGRRKLRGIRGWPCWIRAK